MMAGEQTAVGTRKEVAFPTNVVVLDGNCGREAQLPSGSDQCPDGKLASNSTSTLSLCKFATVTPTGTRLLARCSR